MEERALAEPEILPVVDAIVAAANVALAKAGNHRVDQTALRLDVRALAERYAREIYIYDFGPDSIA